MLNNKLRKVIRMKVDGYIPNTHEYVDDIVSLLDLLDEAEADMKEWKERMGIAAWLLRRKH